MRKPRRGSGVLLAALYLVLAAYLPLSRALPAGHSTRTFLDAWVPIVPWLGPVYVLGMLPIALLPALFYALLPARRFERYAATVIVGALVSYAVYLVYPTEIHRPPLPREPAARWCMALAYAARSPRGIFPSGHAFYTAVNGWFLGRLVSGMGRGVVGAASAAIVAAALLTHLHYAADVAAGLALAAVLMTFFAAGRRRDRMVADV